MSSPDLQPLEMRAYPSRGLTGTVVAPGDKSISHRAIIFGGLANGITTIEGLLEGDDVLRSAAAMRAFGCEVERDNGRWQVRGSAWKSPENPVYFGNSGTGCRLVMGAAAGAAVTASFAGDASLRARPMDRILEPLSAMGAKVISQEGRLPCQVDGKNLRAIEYTLPKPSAQIKSAVLLAGLGANGETIIHEPIICRDHTERMLASFGADIVVEPENSGRCIKLRGHQELTGCHVDVPGDPSSAAFIVASALITEGSMVTVKNVLVNPYRIGFYDTIREMGADIEFANQREVCGEPVADITVRSSDLKGVETPPERAASMIDEYPILCVLAAFADGNTHMTGLKELRVKESDRIAATEAGLNANGVETKSGDDWLTVAGRPGDVTGGGLVKTDHDHRIAMSFLILGLGAKKMVTIDDRRMIATSFPTFSALMTKIGAEVR